ncbi:NADH-ubiquinone oxidoreductase 64 kDa subunit [Aspergillus luchuensis]|uniref:NADH-ubiquinone oxidoreductase 64 kDa subunit n=1 Tax=Aspergillus kawachii TaxID=1069201 RepID=A0A146FSX8_ASPKA|nr:NADH-ubiquinone oxidoreductase 64 kDa subunit [Aspergillus luchuensis]
MLNEEERAQDVEDLLASLPGREGANVAHGQLPEAAFRAFLTYVSASVEFFGITLSAPEYQENSEETPPLGLFGSAYESGLAMKRFSTE